MQEGQSNPDGGTRGNRTRVPTASAAACDYGCARAECETQVQVNNLTETTVESAALTWFKELGYTIAHAPHLAPGEIATERSSFADVLLVARLHKAIAQLNPAIPSDACEEAFRKVLRHDAPSLVGNN